MQEINLYQKEFQPQKLAFSANMALFSALGLVVLFVFLQLLINNAMQKLRVNVEALENQRVATAERVLKIKSEGLKSNAVLLDKRIEELRGQLDERKKLGQIIEWQNLGNEEGFAATLESLARHSSPEFALDRIRISSGGKLLELQGYTRQEQSVPLYLQNLQAEENLSGTRFGLLSMANDKPYKRFSLGFETLYEVAGDNQ